MKTRWVAAIAALALLGAACGGDGDDETAVANDDGTTVPIEVDDGSSEADEGSTAAGGDVPDACSLFDVEEISAAIGREVGAGEPESMPEGVSSCRFETLVGMSTSTSYDEPAIPQDFLGSVTISTTRSSYDDIDEYEKAFDEYEQLLGDEAEAVSGVGDDAYFWGANILYVRVADLQLTIRINADDADESAVRDAVLGLAELGASKLS